MKGQKTGGRKKGTPNKQTDALRALCEKHNIEPFEAMLIQAAKIHSPKDKFDAYEKVCQYIYPKRKAIEHTGKDGESLNNESDDILLAELKQLRAEIKNDGK